MSDSERPTIRVPAPRRRNRTLKVEEYWAVRMVRLDGGVSDCVATYNTRREAEQVARPGEIIEEHIVRTYVIEGL